MASAGPVRTGLAAAFRRPSLVAAEIAWRWSFGTATLALAAAVFYGFLAGLKVTDRDLIALGSRNQDLMAAAITHIFQGSGPRLLRAFAILLPALAVLWTLAASAGRMVTLRALMENPARAQWFSMLALHLVRAILALSAVFAALGIMVFAAWISTAPDVEGMVRPDEAQYLLILLFTLPLLALFWNYLNWMLSLAPVFVVRNGTSATASLAQALRASREYRGRLVGTTAFFALFRIIVMAVVLIASLLAVTILSAAGARVVLAVLILISLVYFAVLDFLFVARLAAIVEICGGASPAISSVLPPSETGPEEALQPSSYSASPV